MFPLACDCPTHILADPIGRPINADAPLRINRLRHHVRNTSQPHHDVARLVNAASGTVVIGQVDIDISNLRSEPRQGE